MAAFKRNHFASVPFFLKPVSMSLASIPMRTRTFACTLLLEEFKIKASLLNRIALFLSKEAFFCFFMDGEIPLQKSFSNKSLKMKLQSYL